MGGWQGLPSTGVSPNGAKLESGQGHSLLAGPGQCHPPLGVGFMPSPPPSGELSEARKVNARVWAQCCPLQAIMYPQERRGPCGSHRGLQGMCGRQKLISGREGNGGHSLPVGDAFAAA